MFVDMSRRNLFGDDVAVLTVKGRRRHLVMGQEHKRRMLCNGWGVIGSRTSMQPPTAIDCVNCWKVIRRQLFRQAEGESFLLDGPESLEVFTDVLLERAERGDKKAMVAYRLAIVALHGRRITKWMVSK